jgi:hypothetical protein
VDLNHIEPKLKETNLCLFNLIEKQAVHIKGLQEENQRLRDEVNRLKGEQGIIKFVFLSKAIGSIKHTHKKRLDLFQR